MNKEKKVNLSDSDKKCLATIDRYYQLDELIFGCEPSIYFEFNIVPPFVETEIFELNNRRLEIFSGSMFKSEV